MTLACRMIFNRIPMCAILGLFLVLFGLLLAGISTVSFLEQIASNKRYNYPNILNLRDYIYICITYSVLSVMIMFKLSVALSIKAFTTLFKVKKHYKLIAFYENVFSILNCCLLVLKYAFFLCFLYPIVYPILVSFFYKQVLCKQIAEPDTPNGINIVRMKYSITINIPLII